MRFRASSPQSPRERRVLETTTRDPGVVISNVVWFEARGHQGVGAGLRLLGEDRRLGRELRRRARGGCGRRRGASRDARCGMRDANAMRGGSSSSIGQIRSANKTGGESAIGRYRWAQWDCACVAFCVVGPRLVIEPLTSRSPRSNFLY